MVLPHGSSASRRAPGAAGGDRRTGQCGYGWRQILSLAHILIGKPVPTFPGYALACAGAACSILMGLAHPSAAQEATTSPTCTGCARPDVAKRQARPRATPRAAPRTPPRSASSRSVSNDGSWAGVSTGPCIPTWRWTLEVGNGAVSGRNTTGQVSRSGAIQGVMVVLGKAYHFTGRMSGTAASGKWVSAACSGVWSAAKS
jgi:hypothetical protein